MKSTLEIKFIELLKKPVKTSIELQEIEVIGRKLELQYREETSDLISELKEVGYDFNDVWQMVNTKKPYPKAIRILLKYLPKDYHDKNKEGIVRALTVKEAVGIASPLLIVEYNKTPKNKLALRWAIGNAIYATITKNDIESILPIIQDNENGVSRQMFIRALGKIGSEQAESTLIKLLDDDEVILDALNALVKLKSKKAKNKIILLVNHPKSSIRNAAQKALIKYNSCNNLL
ncbi:HEAT repeat domain-containing protein [Mucilaginibacter phyllosphaerae]|nr:HEAT repeat domain-containing protein [Mucilaginibacter phyllosphaerae]MBB3971052.1 hypothetical protein [Mucilaginibacter phyllosphaerae]GGH22208.1 hypothetical protein GCM10007352_35350 [Mucilaginibacter phyllosphaerae]